MARVLGFVQVKAPHEPIRIKKAQLEAAEKDMLRQMAEMIAEGESLPFPYVDSDCAVYNGRDSLGLSCNGVEVSGAKKHEILRVDFIHLYGISEGDFYAFVDSSRKSRERFNRQEMKKIESLHKFLLTSFSKKEQAGITSGRIGALEVYAKLPKSSSLRKEYGGDPKKALRMLDDDINYRNQFYGKGAKA